MRFSFLCKIFGIFSRFCTIFSVLHIFCLQIFQTQSCVSAILCMFCISAYFHPWQGLVPWVIGPSGPLSPCAVSLRHCPIAIAGWIKRVRLVLATFCCVFSNWLTDRTKPVCCPRPGAALLLQRTLDQVVTTLLDFYPSSIFPTIIFLKHRTQHPGQISAGTSLIRSRSIHFFGNEPL